VKSSENTPTVPVTVRTVWELDSDKGVLERVYSIYGADGALVSPAVDYVPVVPKYVDTGSGCSLTNAVKEVFYTVESAPTTVPDQIGY
jgi:hypothetical protein